MTDRNKVPRRTKTEAGFIGASLSRLRISYSTPKTRHENERRLEVAGFSPDNGGQQRGLRLSSADRSGKSSGGACPSGIGGNRGGDPDCLLLAYSHDGGNVRITLSIKFSNVQVSA